MRASPASFCWRAENRQAILGAPCWHSPRCIDRPRKLSVTVNGRIEHASLTDVGVKRSHNQDSLAVLLASDEDHWQKQGHIFLVADGMGAHAVGELASELAASIIPLTYHKYTEGDAASALSKAFTEANTSIYARGQQNREFQG